MINLSSQSLYNESSVRQHQLGSLAVDKYGDRYRYVQAGAVALATGHLLQEAAEDTQFRSMAVAEAAAIGATSVEVTLGSTATTANMFEEGELVVESSTGLGQYRRVKRHDVASGAAQCTFVLDAPLKVALTTSSQVSVRKNAYDGVIDYPTTPTGGPVGIAQYAMTIAYFGWVKSGGNCVALFDTGANAAADESGIIPSRDVAGSVTPNLETIAAGMQIGWAREQVSTDSTYSFITLTID